MTKLALARLALSAAAVFLASTPLSAQVEELYLIFPDVRQNAENQTGVAFANDSGTPANLRVNFVGDDGNLAKGPGITNPSIQVVGAGKQTALTLENLFGAGINGKQGMLIVESDNISTVGFFLIFSGGAAITRIDGADAIPIAVTRTGNFFFFENLKRTVIFPELLVGGDRFTRITVVAFSPSTPANVTLELVENGAVVESKVVMVPKGERFYARFSANVDEIFDSPIRPKSFVRAVSSGSGVMGYQEFGSGSFTAGRNAIPEGISNPLTSTLFGAQFASSSAIRTFLKIINPSGALISIDIEAFETGVSAGATALESLKEPQASASKTIQLGPNQVFEEDLGSSLGLEDFVGWIRLTSSRTGIIANSSFGDTGGNFYSSVELQAVPVKRVVNSHVANGLGFGTGVTFLNPFPDPIDVTVDVFDPAGNKTGSGGFQLDGFEHRPRLLSEIATSLGSQVGGFFTVSSTGGLFTFELFFFIPPGQSAIRSMSAVPPQRGNGIVEGTISVIASSQLNSQDASRQDYPLSRAKGVSLDPDYEFLPGEVIVKFESGQALEGKDAILSRTGMEVLQEAPDNISLYRLAQLPTRVALGSSVRNFLHPPSSILHPPSSILHPPSSILESSLEEKLFLFQVIESLNALPEVRYAQPNFIQRAEATVPNDTLYGLQWHYPLINLEEAWDITTGSNNIVVAVIDTGAKFGHGDLAGRLNGGQYDFISDPQRALDGDGIDPFAEDPGDDPSGLNNSYHGTHVGGTIGAVTNNGSGVAGVNWVSPLMTLRALGAGGGSVFDVVQAVRFAAGLPNNSGITPASSSSPLANPSQGGLKAARVINLSLGSSGPCSPLYEEAFGLANAQGAVVVASAGNSSTDTPHSPSDCPGVISVGAIGRSGELASYSNFGTGVDVVAPGGDMRRALEDGVLSTYWSQSSNSPVFEYSQGTSMAAPHVAGVVSLMLSANPNLTPAQVQTVLQDTALDLGAPGRDDQFGHGLINPFLAILSAQNQPLPGPQISVSNGLLDFGSAANQLTAGIRNAGGGNLQVNPPQVETDSGGPWLSAALTQPTSVSGNSPLVIAINLDVSVNRGGLADGGYSGRVNLTSNGGNAVVEVRMLVGQSERPDINRISILAIEPRVFQTIGSTRALLEDGYRYRMQAIAGEYILLAGTDLDNDFFICDEGEFCGAYPVITEPGNVTVISGEEVKNIDFAVQEDSQLFLGSGQTLTIPPGGFPLLREDFVAVQDDTLEEEVP